jgi:hypothetical protein
MGKPKYIESPEKMWEHFCNYRNEIKANPIYIIEQKKGNTIIPKDFSGEMPDSIVKLPTQRPLTIEGFENWCADNDIIEDLGHYFANTDKRYEDYCTICKRIKQTIRQDQIEGGMVGIYNPSITQRLNGLVEKQEREVKGTLNIPQIPDIGKRK